MAQPKFNQSYFISTYTRSITILPSEQSSDTLTLRYRLKERCAMNDKNTYSINFLIVSLFAITVTLVLLLLNRFHPNKPQRPKRLVFRSIGTQSSHTSSDFLQHQLGRQLFLLQQAALKQALRTADVRHVLNQILKARSMGKPTRMPLSEDHFRWISGLAKDQALSVIRLLNHTAVGDWHDQVMSLRMLSPHEQRRAIKISYRHSPDYGEREDTFYA